MSCSSEFHSPILLYLDFLSSIVEVPTSSSIGWTCERLMWVTRIWPWLYLQTKEYHFNCCEVSRGTRELAKAWTSKTCMTAVLSAYFALKNCASGRGSLSWNCEVAVLLPLWYFLFGVKQEVLSFLSLLIERCRCSQVCFCFENQPV